jgi:formiminotetrahydrofolate cyclodeaminase
MSTETLTENTIQQFTEQVGQQKHAMAGATIAASAAQAVALGRACLAITAKKLSASSAKSEVQSQIIRMDTYTKALIDWCNRDATAIADFVLLRESGQPLAGKQLLCNAPTQVCRLAIEAATLLQEFRGQVAEQVQDDMEMAISLLTGAAHAAMLLLDSNLRIWPDDDLLAQFEPIRLELERQIQQLTPVARIRE